MKFSKTTKGQCNEILASLETKDKLLPMFK